MTFDPTFLELMSDQVTIEPYSSETAARVPSYGASVTYSAQVMPWIERVIGSDGREVRSTARVVIPERVAVDTRSRLTLPTGFTPQTPPIIAVRPVAGLGMDHTEILC